MTVHKYFIIVMVLFLPFFMSCKEKKNPDVDEKIENLKKRIKILSGRIASIEERLYKSAKSGNIKVSKTTESVKNQSLVKKPAVKIDRDKFPAEFNYPQYDMKVTNFTCYKGIGNIAVYYGNVVTEKDIQMLNLSISFFGRNGKRLGGHVFPVKVISAKSPRLFRNGDIIDGGFEKIESMELEVDFISYSDFRMKGRAVENPQF